MKNNRAAAAGKTKTIIITAAAGVLVVVIIMMFASGGIGTITDKAAANRLYNGVKAAGMVNGEPFLKQDLDVYAAGLEAVVAAHYGQKYGINGMGASFWETEYDGSTPREFLNKIALDELIRNMVLIQEARKRGIDTPRVYHDLETERQSRNEPTDEIVYGPRTLAPAEYNSYRIGGISDALKTELLKKELAPTVDQMRAAYATLDDGLKIADLYVSAVRFSWDENTVPAAEAYAALENAKRQGLDPEQTVAALAASIPGLSQENFDMNSRFVSKEDIYEQELAAKLGEAAVGSWVSGSESLAEYFYVTAKDGGHIMTFEEAPGLGRNKWINDQFEIFIDKKVKSSRVTLF